VPPAYPATIRVAEARDPGEGAGAIALYAVSAAGRGSRSRLADNAGGLRASLADNARVAAFKRAKRRSARAALAVDANRTPRIRVRATGTDASHTRGAQTSALAEHPGPVTGRVTEARDPGEAAGAKAPNAVSGSRSSLADNASVLRAASAVDASPRSATEARDPGEDAGAKALYAVGAIRESCFSCFASNPRAGRYVQLRRLINSRVVTGVTAPPPNTHTTIF
jgi:hypothetical protein